MTEHRFAPQRFAEVHVGTQRRFIRITAERGNLVIGTRVNRDGSTWERETADTVQTNLIISHRDEVIREMRLNLHFAELEPIPVTGRG